jgi:hypothetical protein
MVAVDGRGRPLVERNRRSNWPRVAVTTLGRVAAVALALIVTIGSDTKLLG